MEHTFKIGLEASKREEAKEVLEDLLSIRQSIGDKDVKALAKLLREKPGIINTAKQLLG